MQAANPPPVDDRLLALAPLPAVGAGLVLWLFVARLAHATPPGAGWWLGLVIALGAALAGSLLCRRWRKAAFWGGFVLPATAATATALAPPGLLASGLAAAACAGGLAAVLDWARVRPGRSRVAVLEALAGGATCLAGIAPPGALPVIGSIALVLLAAVLAIRCLAVPRIAPIPALLVAVLPALLLAHGLLVAGGSLRWLAGPLCVLGLLHEARRRDAVRGGGAV